jgi:hypothetical protein
MNRPDIDRIVSTATSWPGVAANRFQNRGTDFLIGCREIGHLHGDELVDIPFPRRVRDDLVGTGRARPHHVLRNSGWVSVPLKTDADIERAVELLKLSYELAAAHSTVSAGKERSGGCAAGPGHPSHFPLVPRCEEQAQHVPEHQRDRREQLE